MHKVISLFSGCGGLDYGFKKAGFEIVFANDINPSVKDTYEFNLGHKLLVEDLRIIDKTKIPSAEIIIAGIPCQPFSSAGKRLSTKCDDGNLFLEVLKVVEAQDSPPKVVLFENVRGFLSSKDEDGILLTDRFEQEMQKLGYNTQFQLLNAADYGVPSNRYRVFIICVHRSIDNKFFFPVKNLLSSPVTVGEVLATPLPDDEPIEIWDLPPSSQKVVKYIKEGGSWKDIPYEHLSERHRKIRDNIKFYRSPNFYRRFSRNEVMGTITATSSPENSGILHPLEDRRYSVREIARFQSYPDSFKFIGASVPNKYKMIGNSVPPLLAQAIAKAIKTQVFSSVTSVQPV